MFSLTSSFCYFLYRNPTDMRLGMDGLCGLVRGQLRRFPGSGEVFLFINKPRNKVKLLRWEEGGFILYYKRLEQGTFELPTFSLTATSCVLSWAELVMIIEGISIQKIQRRKRFSKLSGY
ncbi:MAG: IS66 family insertion sequence element accessory protein TnpB [Bacteroidales bacterium]